MIIIVSQDKNTIVNFETLSEIYKSGKQVLCAFPYIENYVDTLGTYETEERAKEVLQEIIQAIRGNSKITMTGTELTTEAFGGFYEMPEE